MLSQAKAGQIRFGIAKNDTQTQAHLRAFETDPTSCYGGILAFNHGLEAATVQPF
ncbi:MAG: hypothetical protein H0U75_11515 [Legionella sp.]|nr:hypothetical protein [Legionella sp.]